MIRPQQEQSGAENSTNYQAGKDIHVYGLTIDEARTVALDVFHSNALELAGIARAIALARAEQLTTEFIAKLEKDMPERASKLADPDVQSVLFEAQKEFARSGEEDLKTVLIDLLAARAREDERNLRTLALNEAIVSASKLTEQQRRAIAWIFHLRYTRDSSAETPGTYLFRLGDIVFALGVDIPTGQADYQHIEYVGAGAIGVSEFSLGAAILAGNQWLFTRGFAESEADPELIGRLRALGLVGPAIRDSNRLQLLVRADSDFDATIAELGLTKYGDAIRPLLFAGRMTEAEVADEASKAIVLGPNLRANWDKPESAIRVMTLTSVGIAIGHAYWARLTGATAPLSIWLP